VQVNIHTAKTNLSRLIEKAQSGEEAIIAKSGRQRVFGATADRIVFHKGWDSPMGEKELKEFLG
jgi:hypothetical protein